MWSAVLFKHWLQYCLVEKADSFYGIGVVVYPDTSSDALIPNTSSDWLLNGDEARGF